MSDPPHACLDRLPARQEPVMGTPATEQTVPEGSIEPEFEPCRLPRTAGKRRCCPETFFRRDGVDGHVPCHDVSLAPPDAAYLPIDDDRDIDRLHRAGSGINDSAADQITDQGSGRPRVDRHPHAVIGPGHAPVLRAASRAPRDERHEDDRHGECRRSAHGGGESSVGHWTRPRQTCGLQPAGAMRCP